MSPYQYLAIEERERAIISGAEERIRMARDEANYHPFPIKMRPAEAEDIRPGIVIWHRCGDLVPYWNVVSEPLHYGDAFKAYVADDGCRYGLEGAYIDLEDTPNKLIRELRKIL